MNNPAISIIVPVYNVEQYLRRCLDSILSQSFTVWEAIIVDDGSTDESGIICDEYVKADKRFKVVHKKNAGVALARQTGVDNSVGKYIIHVDSDDYIEPKMLEEMYSAIIAQQVDVLVCDYMKENGQGNTTYYNQKPSDSSVKGLLADILRDKLHGALWNKLVDRKCYFDYKATFFEGLNYAEDVLIWAQISNTNMKVGYIPHAYYHYVENDNSITHAVTKNLFRIQRRYIYKLNSIGIQRSLVLSAAYRIKLGALRCDVLTKEDYYDSFTPDISTINERKELANILFGYFSYCNLFVVGSIIFKMVNTLQNNKIYKMLRNANWLF